MTAVAQNRSGLSVNEEAMSQLEQIAERKSTEEVSNRLSGRTEERTTYYMGGLNICTIVRMQGEVIEIQDGLLNHPIVKRLSQ